MLDLMPLEGTPGRSSPRVPREFRARESGDTVDGELSVKAGNGPSLRLAMTDC